MPRRGQNRIRPPHNTGASALTPDEERELARIYLSFFEQGHPVRKFDIMYAAQQIKARRQPSNFDHVLSKKELSESWFRTFILRTPNLSNSRNSSIIYQPHKITRHEVDTFFANLVEVWSNPPIVSTELFYLCWTSFPTHLPPSLETTPDQWVNVLDCHSAAGFFQESPTFFQYGHQIQDPRITSVPSSATRDLILHLWFDKIFPSAVRRGVLLIDETKVVPSSEFKAHCLSRNVVVVGIPAALAPHFFHLNFFMAPRLTEFYQGRRSPPPEEDIVASITHQRSCIVKRKLKERWDDAAVCLEEAASSMSEAFYANVPDSEKADPEDSESTHVAEISQNRNESDGDSNLEKEDDSVSNPAVDNLQSCVESANPKTSNSVVNNLPAGDVDVANAEESESDPDYDPENAHESDSASGSDEQENSEESDYNLDSDVPECDIEMESNPVADILQVHPGSANPETSNSVAKKLSETVGSDATGVIRYTQSDSDPIRSSPVPPPAPHLRIFSPASLSSSDDEFFSAQKSVSKTKISPSQSGGNRLTVSSTSSSPRSFVPDSQPDNPVSHPSSDSGNIVPENWSSLPANVGRSKPT